MGDLDALLKNALAKDKHYIDIRFGYFEEDLIDNNIGKTFFTTLAKELIFNGPIYLFFSRQNYTVFNREEHYCRQFYEKDNLRNICYKEESSNIANVEYDGTPFDLEINLCSHIPEKNQKYNIKTDKDILKIIYPTFILYLSMNKIFENYEKNITYSLNIVPTTKNIDTIKENIKEIVSLVEEIKNTSFKIKV